MIRHMLYQSIRIKIPILLFSDNSFTHNYFKNIIFLFSKKMNWNKMHQIFFEIMKVERIDPKKRNRKRWLNHFHSLEEGCFSLSLRVYFLRGVSNYYLLFYEFVFTPIIFWPTIRIFF